MKPFRYIRFLAASFVFVNIVQRCPALTKEHFVMSGFIFHPKMIVDPKQAFRQIHVSTECKCRALCLVHAGCKCCSWIWQNGHIICSFFDKPFGQLTFISAPNGYTAALTDQFKFIGADGLEYYCHPYLKNFTDAVKLCENLGVGYQLGVYKTLKQLNVLQKVYNERNQLQIWINLIPISSLQTGKWPDDTYYSATEIGQSNFPIYAKDDPPSVRIRFDGNSFNDRESAMEYGVLCQRIP